MAPLILKELTVAAPRGVGSRTACFPRCSAFAYYTVLDHVRAPPGVVVPATTPTSRTTLEHEYALPMQERPEWEDIPYEGSFAGDFGDYDRPRRPVPSDLLRRALHKLESETNMRQPRFR